MWCDCNLLSYNCIFSLNWIIHSFNYYHKSKLTQVDDLFIDISKFLQSNAIINIWVFKLYIYRTYFYFSHLKYFNNITKKIEIRFIFLSFFTPSTNFIALFKQYILYICFTTLLIALFYFYSTLLFLSLSLKKEPI